IFLSHGRLLFAGVFDRTFFTFVKGLSHLLHLCRRAEGKRVRFPQAPALPDVADQVYPFMEVQIDGIVTLDGLGNAVLGFFCFRLKGSKYAVPDDQRGSIVLVEVPLVAGVVHAVVRWCGENKLDDTGKLPYVFGMYPELVQHGNLVTDQKCYRVETDQRYRDEKDDLNVLGPSESEGDRPVVFLRIVVRYVRRPPEAVLVCDAVGPVTPEVNPYKAKDERPPRRRNTPRDEVVEEQYYTERKNFQCRVQPYVA